MCVSTGILAYLIPRLVNLRNYYYNKMFFDYWIKFTQETYLFLGVCVFLNFNYFHFHSIGNKLNSVLSIILGLGLLLFPFILLGFYNLSANLNKIFTRDKEFASKYCSVLEGLNLDRLDRKVLLFPFLETIRKLVLILTVIIL